MIFQDDPCEWSSSPPAAAVAVGQVTNLGTITIKKGPLLHVRIQDDKGSLAANERKPGAHLLIGVWSSNGLFHPMPARARDPKGRDYEIPIPYDTPLTLSVQGTAFVLADAIGTLVDKQKGASVPVLVKTGDVLKVITYHVTGTNR